MAIAAYRCWLEGDLLEIERTTWAHDDCVALDRALPLLRDGQVIIVAGGEIASLRESWANDGQPHDQVNHHI